LVRSGNDDHKELIPALVGYPGAFIREVAVYALTQCAYDDLNELSYELLDARSTVSSLSWMPAMTFSSSAAAAGCCSQHHQHQLVTL